MLFLSLSHKYFWKLLNKFLNITWLFLNWGSKRSTLINFFSVLWRMQYLILNPLNRSLVSMPFGVFIDSIFRFLFCEYLWSNRFCFLIWFSQWKINRMLVSTWIWRIINSFYLKAWNIRKKGIFICLFVWV